MSKWNKQTPQINEEFIQNEQRRKQMIIEAGRRRREKEKKQSEMQEQQLKDTQQALTRHKAQKKDAYVRYLRNNMHDKYQQVQRQQKQKQEIQSKSKWKKRTPSQDSNEHLDALDLEVKVKEEKPKGQKNQIVKEFEKEWNDDFEEDWKNDQQDQLLGSQLLDSLDLDFGSINRQKEVKQMMKDQRVKEQPQKITKQSPQFKDELKRLKQLIGYESMVMGESPKKAATAPKQQVKPEPKDNNKSQKKTKPQANQVQTFNELRRKKQGKIMNWAIEQEQQAQDLFSNCSSRKRPNVALRELNEELKNKKPQMSANLLHNHGDLEVIQEQSKKKQDLRSNVVRKTKEIKTSQQARGTSRSMEKVQAKTSTSAFAKKKAEESKNVLPARTVSNSFDRKKSLEERKQSIGKRTAQGKSCEEPNQKIVSQPVKNQRKPEPKQEKKKIAGNIPPLPRYDNTSIVTHDMQIDVQSFIRQDLIGLNQHEQQLQAELRNIHNLHKNDIKQVFNKYNIKTDYQHSAQITGETKDNHKQGYSRPTQAQIQQSLENLDHLLIRRELQSREQQNQQEELKSQSFINPFSNSEDLCQQVLQLAKNVSRFEKEVSQPVPNGYLQKAGRVKKQQIPVSKHTSGVKARQGDYSNKYGSYASASRAEEGQVMGQSQCQSQQVSQVPLQGPPVMTPSQKIHVNKQLLRGLLDDDD